MPPTHHMSSHARAYLLGAQLNVSSTTARSTAARSTATSSAAARSAIGIVHSMATRSIFYRCSLHRRSLHRRSLHLRSLHGCSHHGCSLHAVMHGWVAMLPAVGPAAPAACYYDIHCPGVLRVLSLCATVAAACNCCAHGDTRIRCNCMSCRVNCERL